MAASLSRRRFVFARHKLQNQSHIGIAGQIVRRLIRPLLLLIALAALLAGGPCLAAPSRLAEFLAQAPAAELVPGADHYGPIEGAPPLVKALAGDKLVGYAFVNADWVELDRLFRPTNPDPGRPDAAGQDRRRAADGAPRADRADRHPAGAHRRVHPRLCRPRRPRAQPCRFGGTAAGRHRQRRDCDSDGHRREHGAVGGARGAHHWRRRRRAGRGDRRRGKSIRTTKRRPTGSVWSATVRSAA